MDDIRSGPKSQKKKKFLGCLLKVRALPLEDFRLSRDGRKWKQAARSRSDLLLKLSTYANPDGTFESADGDKNFSPSAKKLQRHYAKKTLYRLTNDLRELGFLSWKRERKHYGRRTYNIHIPPLKQVSYSRQEQVSHSQEQVSPRHLITGATMGPNPPLKPTTVADAVAVASFGRFDSIVPSGCTPLQGGRGAAVDSLSGHRHPLSAKSDDDDRRERENRHRLPNALARKKPDEDLERVRIHKLKTTALLRFNAIHPEVDPTLAELWLDLIEERAKRTIVSAEYFVTALRNELKEHEESRETASETNSADVSETREAVPAQDSAKRRSDYRDAVVLFLTDKLAKSGAASVEEARDKVLEVIDKKGHFKSWEKCRDLCALIRTDVFPNTPEPREDTDRGYFPKTVLELLDLAGYSRDFPELYGFGTDYNRVFSYLLRNAKFETSEERRKFEDRIAYQHERKKSDEERKRYRDKVNRRNRELRAERKARSAMDSNDATRGGEPHNTKDVERTLAN